MYKGNDVNRFKSCSQMAAIQAAGLLLCLVSLPAASQEISFVDNFSSDSINYRSDSFTTDNGLSSAIGIPGAIDMFAIGNSEGSSNVFVELMSSTDTLLVTTAVNLFAYDSDDQDASAVFSVEGNLYNDTGDNSIDGYGDVALDVSITIDSNGNGVFSGCATKHTRNSFEPVYIFNDGADSCFIEDVIEVIPGVEYEIGYRFDRDSKKIEMIFDDTRIQANIESDVYPSQQPYHFFSLLQENTPAEARAQVFSVETDSGLDDFTGTTPILDRYDSFKSDSARFIGVENERLMVKLDSNAHSSNLDFAAGSLTLHNPTDHIEAILEVSSASMLEKKNAQIQVEIDMVTFNSLRDGGGDGSLGEVRARMRLLFDAKGRRELQYCLTRYSDADFNQKEELLADTDTFDNLENINSCETLTVDLELDTAYQASISLDRSNSSLTYNFEHLTKTISYEGEMFAAKKPYTRLNFDAGPTAVGVFYVDDIRTFSAFDTTNDFKNKQAKLTPLSKQTKLTILDVDSTLISSFPFVTPEPFDNTGDVNLIYGTLSEQDIGFLANSNFQLTNDSPKFFFTGLEKTILYSYGVASADSTDQIRTIIAPPDGDSTIVKSNADNLQVSVYSENALELVWDHITGSPPAAGYEIRRDGRVLMTTNGRSHFAEGLQAGKAYFYEIITLGFDGQRSEPLSISVNTNDG